MRGRALLAGWLLAALAACGSDRDTISIGAVSVDGARIAVHDSCRDDPRLEVEERDASVEIELTVAEEDSGGDCFSCTIVELDTPVGDREVVDRSTGAVLPQTGDCFTVLE